MINRLKKHGNSYYLNVPRGIVIIDNWENVQIKLTEWTNKKLVFEKFDLFENEKNNQKNDKNRKS